MRELMISIQPKWVEKICRKEKTVEVRKTRPKCEVPFKCYIYETKALYKPNGCKCLYEGKGKVIGEFVCDKIYNLSVALDPIDCSAYFPDGLDHTEGTCLTKEELAVYLCGGNWSGKGYGLNLTDLVVYDEPRVLGDFRSYNVRTYIDEKSGLPMPTHEITRPFMSWGYVEATEPRQTAD